MSDINNQDQEKSSGKFKELTRKRKAANRKKRSKSFYTTNVDFFLARNKRGNK